MQLAGRGGATGRPVTNGANGPAALASIVRISENDVDWMAALITHMGRNALSGVQPTQQAEDAWTDTVYALSQYWYAGANVKHKAGGLSMLTGGFPKYREACAAAAQNGYRDLVFETAQAMQPA